MERSNHGLLIPSPVSGHMVISPSWYVWHLSVSSLLPLLQHCRPFLSRPWITGPTLLKQQLYYIIFLWIKLSKVPKRSQNKVQTPWSSIQGSFQLCFNYFAHKYSDLTKLFCSPPSEGSPSIPVPFFFCPEACSFHIEVLPFQIPLHTHKLFHF